MYKELTSVLALGLGATIAPAGEIVNDDFSGGSLDRTVWTDGGGFLVTGGETLLISSFGGSFGRIWNDPTTAGNTAPLNSQTGYASIDVLPNGEVPLEGNFMISNTTSQTNSATALLDLRFGDGAANDGSGLGAGSYEILWNNSGTTMNFELPISGFAGTIAGNGTMVIKDGDTANPIFGTTDAPANVNVGDFGMSYHLWTNQPGETMIVDNVVIHDMIPAPVVAALIGDYDGSGFVSQSDLDLVLLNWGSSTIPAEWVATDQFDGVQVSQNELDGVLLNWGDGTPPALAAVPEPASIALLGLGGLALASRRRR